MEFGDGDHQIFVDAKGEAPIPYGVKDRVPFMSWEDLSLSIFKIFPWGFKLLQAYKARIYGLGFERVVKNVSSALIGSDSPLTLYESNIIYSCEYGGPSFLCSSFLFRGGFVWLSPFGFTLPSFSLGIIELGRVSSAS